MKFNRVSRDRAHGSVPGKASWRTVITGVLLAIVFIQFGLARAQEDLNVPELDAIGDTLSDTYTPGDEITLSFVSHDEGAAGTFDVRFWFSDAVGHEIAVASHAPSSGVEEFAFGSVREDAIGQYILTRIELTDFDGNTAVYLDDGSVEVFPDEASGPHDHQFTFSDFQFEVLNDNVDRSAPVLDSVQLAGNPVLGTRDILRIEFAAHDVASNEPVDSVSFVLSDGAGNSLPLSMASANSGIAELVIGPLVPAGTYTLRIALLVDWLGNAVQLLDGGVVVPFPPYVTAPSAHGFAFGGVAVTIERSAADANCDDAVDAIDAMQVLQAIVGLGDVCSPDANGDGFNDLGDALYILLALAGL